MSMVCDVYAVSPARLDRLRSDPDFYPELTDWQDNNAQSCSLEKAWHGLHYLLCGKASDSTEPLAFIASGGSEIEAADSGYGPARMFTPEETQRIHSELSPITEHQLWSRFDADAMFAQGVYPEIWDEPEDELQEEYTMYFADVKQLVADAASQGCGLLVMLA